MWVKESCDLSDSYHNYRKNGANCDYDGSVLGGAASVSRVQQQHSVLKQTDHNYVAVCSEPIDPLMLDIELRLERNVEHAWVDPIVVNETAGWRMILPNVNRESRAEPDQTCDKVPSLSNKQMNTQMNTRGRPRKVNHQPCRIQKHPQSSSKSSLEASENMEYHKAVRYFIQ